MTEDDRTRDLWLLSFGLVSVTTSLVVRAIHRGSYIPGWDLIAATQGHMLASTLPFWNALRQAWYQNRHYWLPFPTYSIPFSLIPGYLGRLWPWPYWAHLCTLASFIGTLVLILWSARLKMRQIGILLLAWGASPMLLSHSIAGYPWASGFVSHALALYVTMNRRLHAHWLATACLAFLAIESSWHVYQPSRSVSVVFLAALFFYRRAPILTRLVWLCAAAVQVIEAAVIHPSPSSTTFFSERVGFLTGAMIWEGVRDFIKHLWANFFDLPTIWILGVLSLALFKRDRWFLTLLLLVQVALVIYIAIPAGATTSDALRPRRFIAVEGYCLVAIICMFREAGWRARRTLIGVLLIGNVWQAANLTSFILTPKGNVGFPMPYMTSHEGVGLVSFEDVDGSRGLRMHAKAGGRFLLLHNFSCYTESMTNPEGLLEFLYLSLGHKRFVSSVFVFGSESCRYSCLPIRSLAEFTSFLDGIRPGGPTPPSTLTAYYDQGCKGPGKDAKEPDTMFAIIRQRFRVATESLPDARFLRFRFETIMASPVRPTSHSPRPGHCRSSNVPGSRRSSWGAVSAKNRPHLSFDASYEL